MACGLEEEWQRLKLTADEEQIVVMEDNKDNAKDEQIALCLFGRLYTQSSFNARAMKSVLCNPWKSTKRLIVRDLDPNLFIFQFFSAADRDYALNKGPFGRLRHVLGGCVAMEAQEDNPCLQYGPLLRMSPLKSRCSNGNCSIMSIDETTPIVPENEAFKRKQGDTQLHKRDERYDYTWCNFQDNDVVVEEHLDYFCANMDWSILFRWR
ncbi:hypothetical protein Cgig2_015900 [Carnegiea gigantea]|uniref:DUF4283 domain-containing protein n=1 Tax=Carnegiea gigantea TaxID=171969 RepID=A0A9Q1JN99_9CARY|nr:hypothetical protein Cgig2_015900 [Carnegiea gigantea]